MPETQSSFWTAVWLVLLAMLGGLVNYRAKVIAGKVPAFSTIYLVGELATSGFVGFLAFRVCQATGLSLDWTAVCVGAAGHMGGRFIETLEGVVKQKLGL